MKKSKYVKSNSDIFLKGEGLSKKGSKKNIQEKKQFYTLKEVMKHIREERKKWYYPFKRFYYNIKGWIKEQPYSFKYLIQRHIKGYSDNEISDLDYAIAKFIIPRLKQFIKEKDCSGLERLTDKQWKKILRKILKAFELIIKQSGPIPKKIGRKKFLEREKKMKKEMKEGMLLFAKWMRALWL